MTTYFLGFAAELLAGFAYVFAFTGSMAKFSAEVGAAAKFSTTDLAATCVGKPAWLIFQVLLAAHAGLFHQEGAFGTGLLVAVAVVRDLRMTTILGSFAFKSARRRSSTTGQRRLKNCSSTMTGNFVEDSLATAATRSFMTELWAWMIPAFQGSTTEPSADVFSLETVVKPWCSTKGTQLSLRSQPFRCFTLSLATVLAALMSAAIERGLADAHALRWFLHKACRSQNDRFLDMDVHMGVASSILSGNSESGHHKIAEVYPIFPSKQSYRKDSERRRPEIGDNAADPVPEDGIATHISAFHSQKLGHKIHHS
ncbi:hypothetical protein MMC30_004226 [Trapelia coarctata]|nr:hypothetical protein [Trapelia coarctata]